MLEDIESARKRHVPFESRQPRERSACPKCGSILVRKRFKTHDYICKKCDWIGVTIKKVMW